MLKVRVAIVVLSGILLPILLLPCGILANERLGGGPSSDALSGSVRDEAVVDGNAPSVDLIVRDSFLPGVPVLVRVQVTGEGGAADKDLWDANAVLSVSGNPAVKLSMDRLAVRNGLGSGLVTFTGRGDFDLTVSVAGLEKTVGLADWTDEPVHVVSGTLGSSRTWSGVYHVEGDLTIPRGVTLTLSPGTLVLIDGAASGTDGADIDVQGAIQSLGTAASPVTFTAFAPGRNWGELHHAGAEPSTYCYTEILQAGRSPKVGHSNSGPAVRASSSSLVFDYASLTDHAGKIMQATDGTELTFRGTLFARSVMGPEIAETSVSFEDGWIMEMRAKDDADGVYIHSQLPGQLCRLARSVIAGTDDDGVDTLGSDVLIEDCVIRGCKDKAVSVFGGQTTLRRSLVVGNNLAPEDPTVASIVAKSNEGETTVVHIDHTTLVATRAPDAVDAGIQSHNKSGVKTGRILYYATNSIVDATMPVYVQPPYLQSDIHISYCDIVGVEWPGDGNISADPRFVDPEHGDYRLDALSPCIGAADPDSPLTDLGCCQSGRE
jgi:hypothetical protein